VTKQCGNCKWWDEEVYKVPDEFNNLGLCINTNLVTQPKYSNEGQDCPVFEERERMKSINYELAINQYLRVLQDQLIIEQESGQMTAITITQIKIDTILKLKEFIENDN